MDTLKQAQLLSTRRQLCHEFRKETDQTARMLLKCEITAIDFELAELAKESRKQNK